MADDMLVRTLVNSDGERLFIATEHRHTLKVFELNLSDGRLVKKMSSEESELPSGKLLSLQRSIGSDGILLSFLPANQSEWNIIGIAPQQTPPEVKARFSQIKCVEMILRLEK